VIASPVNNSAVANINTEQIIASTMLDPSTLRVGSSIGFRVVGTVGCAAASGTLTIKLKIGAVTVATATFASSATAATSTPTTITGRVAFGTVGAASTWGSAALAVGGPGPIAQVVPATAASGSTIDLTTSQQVTVTATWAAANASNALTVQSQIEVVN